MAALATALDEYLRGPEHREDLVGGATSGEAAVGPSLGGPKQPAPPPAPST